MSKEVLLSRDQLDALSQVPVVLDALVHEEDDAWEFVKTLTREDPGVAQQRVTPSWPHHLPGELAIALTGQAAVIALQRKGLIDSSWRGHGVRIRDARFSAAVFLGESFRIRVELRRVRRIRGSLHVQLRFRMWKHDAAGHELETYRSEQDAIFFPGS